MLVLLLLSFLNPLSIVLNTQDQAFTIKGRTTAPHDGYIYLQYGGKKDSVMVLDQRFEFSGSVAHPMEARFRTKSSATQEYFYLENSAMEIEVEITPPMIKVLSVAGNKTMELMIHTLEAINDLGGDSFEAGLYNILDTLIQNNPRNQYCGMILSEVSMDPILSFEQIQSLYSKLDSTTIHPDDKVLLEESIIKLREIRIGGKLMSFRFPDVKGNLIGPEDYDEKLLLVEFWASDCRPCRITNPQLVEIQKNFKESGFDVLGVSLDTREDAWQKAIQKDGLTWKQTIVPDAFNNATLKKLGIQYLPSNYLLDQNGTIRAINIKPQELRILLLKHN